MLHIPLPRFFKNPPINPDNAAGESGEEKRKKPRQLHKKAQKIHRLFMLRFHASPGTCNYFSRQRIPFEMKDLFSTTVLNFETEFAFISRMLFCCLLALCN